MSSKIFIGDHSTLIIAFAHVTHVVSNPTDSPLCIEVYLINLPVPIRLHDVWAQAFHMEYVNWASSFEPMDVPG